MTLPTRVLLVEWANVSRVAGDENRLRELFRQYSIWVKERIGASFLLDGPIVVRSTLPEPSPDQLMPVLDQSFGLWTHPDAATIFIVTGTRNALWAGAGVGQMAIHGGAVLQALRGESPQVDWPGWIQRLWPNVALGGVIHEVIHAWGVAEHDAGIMAAHWDYPNTFISEKDKAILLASHFISVDIPIIPGCPPCPHGHIDGCDDCPPPPPGAKRFPWLLISAAGIMGFLAAQRDQ